MARLDDWLRPAALAHVLVASTAAIVIIGFGVLFLSDGWDYYRTPLQVRAYHPAHDLLRPSGTVGQPLGAAGVAMMTMPLVYSVRKKWKRAAHLGNLKTWLDVHIFCGTVGPVLVTFHAALKFNGLIAVAYWSMVIVVVSGFVGRYLYVRIPRTIRGAELSYDEVEERAQALNASLEAAGIGTEALAEVEAAAPGLRGAFGRRRVARRLVAMGLTPVRACEVVRLASDRATLLRRLAKLNRTRELFAMWHVFHLPLVYVMFSIALVHIGLAAYFGYASIPRG